MTARSGNATGGSEASEARVAAAKHLLDETVSSRVEQASLRQAFAAKVRSYDEQTSIQVSYGWDGAKFFSRNGGEEVELQAVSSDSTNSFFFF